MNEVTFDREDRYTVIKHKDLTVDERAELDQLIHSRHIPTRECLVIESDWPEYEPAWRMIEARVTKAAPSAPKADDPVKQMLMEALGEIAWSNNSQWQADRARAAIAAARQQAREVVMPERKTAADFDFYIDSFAAEAAEIHNRVIDEFTRLNGKEVV